MKKLLITAIILLCAQLSFGQEIDGLERKKAEEDGMNMISNFVLADFKTAALVKSIKEKTIAVDTVLKHREDSYLSLVDSIDVEVKESKIISVKVFSQNREYQSQNQFFISTNSSTKFASIDTTVKMDIHIKPSIVDEPGLDYVVTDVNSINTKTGYKVIVKRKPKG